MARRVREGLERLEIHRETSLTVVIVVSHLYLFFVCNYINFSLIHIISLYNNYIQRCNIYYIFTYHLTTLNAIYNFLSSLRHFFFFILFCSLSSPFFVVPVRSKSGCRARVSYVFWCVHVSPSLSRCVCVYTHIYSMHAYIYIYIYINTRHIYICGRRSRVWHRCTLWRRKNSPAELIARSWIRLTLERDYSISAVPLFSPFFPFFILPWVSPSELILTQAGTMRPAATSPLSPLLDRFLRNHVSQRRT